MASYVLALIQGSVEICQFFIRVEKSVICAKEKKKEYEQKKTSQSLNFFFSRFPFVSHVIIHVAQEWYYCHGTAPTHRYYTVAIVLLHVRNYCPH